VSPQPCGSTGLTPHKQVRNIISHHLLAFIDIFVTGDCRDFGHLFG
jgi:hypothetical protein